MKGKTTPIDTRDRMFSGPRRCAVCGVVVAIVACGHLGANRSYGGLVEGQHVCKKHREGK